MHVPARPKNGSVGRAQSVPGPLQLRHNFRGPRRLRSSGHSVEPVFEVPELRKRHDPKNRLLQLSYQREHFWQVDKC